MNVIDKARLNTYNLWLGSQEVCLCPKCKECMIIRGYVCLGCGYDNSTKKM